MHYQGILEQISLFKGKISLKGLTPTNEVINVVQVGGYETNKPGDELENDSSNNFLALLIIYFSEPKKVSYVFSTESFSNLGKGTRHFKQ